MAVKVEGLVERIGDWQYLRIDPATAIDPTHLELLGKISTCTDSQLAVSN